MDLASGFWQVPVRECDKCKTAFSTRDGLSEFNTMPFRLCNAPATFERVMENVLHEVTWNICLVYVDDIVVAGPTVEETTRCLGLVWKSLRGAGLKLKPSKCDLFWPSVTFLGHVVSEQGVDTDPGKITALTQRPRPNCIEDVRSFLGLAAYYRDHVQNYADIAAPLHALMKKGVSWTWDGEEEWAYQGLVATLTSDTLLAHPCLNDGGWVVDTDALR